MNTAPPAERAAPAVPAPPPLSSRASLFLDFDGTLAAIAPRPDQVTVGAWLVPALERLRHELDGALALISGRPLAELDVFVAPLRLPAAGVHGIERREAHGRVVVQAGSVPVAIVLRAQRLAALHPGLQIEAKPAAIALHYREAPQLGALCRRSLQAATRPHPDWAVLHGKCVVEVKPAGASKAHAVRAFSATPVFAGRVPVFVGDDVTDEDGFAAVQAAGGVGIKVGDGPSGARHRLADPEAVRRWLLASIGAWDAELARAKVAS